VVDSLKTSTEETSVLTDSQLWDLADMCVGCRMTMFTAMLSDRGLYAFICIEDENKTAKACYLTKDLLTIDDFITSLSVVRERLLKDQHGQYS
jgi:hypothetical protein